MTVTGVLQQLSGTAWKAYAGQPVQLWFQAKGASKYTLVSSGKTSSTGLATLKGKATVDGTWLIRYLGDATHFNSTATGDFVDVR